MSDYQYKYIIYDLYWVFIIDLEKNIYIEKNQTKFRF